MAQIGLGVLSLCAVARVQRLGAVAMLVVLARSLARVPTLTTVLLEKASRIEGSVIISVVSIMLGFWMLTLNAPSLALISSTLVVFNVLLFESILAVQLELSWCVSIVLNDVTTVLACLIFDSALPAAEPVSAVPVHWTCCCLR